MPGNPRTSRGRLSLTSLIDVIFLLLLFFMLSSTFSKFGEVELTVSGGAASPDFDGTPVVFARLDADGVVINGHRSALADIAAAVDPFRRDGHARLLLSVSQNADAQGFVEVVQVLSALPNTRFAVLE